MQDRVHHFWVVRLDPGGVEREGIARRETGTQKSLSSEIPGSFEQRGTHHIRAVFAVCWDVVPWVAAAGVLQQEGGSHQACRSRWVTVTSAATESQGASIPSLTAKGVLRQGNSSQVPTAGHGEVTLFSSSTSLALSTLPSGACPTILSPLSTHCLPPPPTVSYQAGKFSIIPVAVSFGTSIAFFGAVSTLDTLFSSGPWVGICHSSVVSPAYLPGHKAS